MISSLHGRVLEMDEEALTLDVSGVGYEVHCSLNTLSQVQSGQELRLWVHTQLREDAIALYGFSSRAEKQMFMSLIKVNGIGPKMAQKVLSGATVERLAEMIEAGDVRGLSGLPKVGKKTAEQMILALKGKLVLSGNAQFGPGSNKDDITSALIHLGFRATEVEKTVQSMGPEVGLEEGVRLGLQALTNL